MNNNMWKKFFSGEVAVYASTEAEAARFIKAYMDTGAEKLSAESQAFASASPDIEFAYNFSGIQLGWAEGPCFGPNQGWYQQHADWRATNGYVSNPGAPYKSITVKEFFGDE